MRLSSGAGPAALGSSGRCVAITRASGGSGAALSAPPPRAALGLVAATLLLALFTQTSRPGVAAEPVGNEAIHLEGVSVVRKLAPDGRVESEREPQRFSAWLSGCQWAVRLYGDTNLPGGMTDLTCDATNIYVFVPTATGTLMDGTRYLGDGNVRPGRVEVFFLWMGPIWWAYCSSCVTGGTNATVLDFMDLLGYGRESRATVSLRVGEQRLPPASVGAPESWLYATADADRLRVDPSRPLAHLKPLQTITTNGLSVVTRVSVTIYRRGSYFGAESGTENEPSCEHLISINSVSFETNPISFVPQVTKTAMLMDHRQPYMGEYMADHWLGAQERKATRRFNMQAGERSSSSRALALRVLVWAIILVPIAGIGLSRLRGRTARRS
jgi:hypothetical protein